MKNIFTLVILLLFGINISFAQAQCPRISSICIKSCVSPEGLNEFFIFTTGTAAINISDIDIEWATTTINFTGFAQNTVTATKVAAANLAIDNANGCGNVIEPTISIPANAKVLVFTSYNVDFSAISFGALGEDIYVLFANNANSTGHFANNGSGMRYLTLSVSSPGLTCSQTVGYDRSLVSTANGASASFDNAGTASYFVNNCIVPSTPSIGADLTLVSPSANYSGCVNTAISPINFSSSNATNVVATGLPSGVSGTWTAGTNSFVVSGTPTVPGTFNYKVKATGICGADSILGTLSIIPSISETRNISICQGQNYNFYGNVYTTTTTGITHTISNTSGCDSIITLNLTVNPYLEGDRMVSICPNESYTFNGINYNAAISGIKDTIANTTGCDSVVTLYLSVLPYNFASLYEVICEGDSFIFNGIAYTQSISVTDTIANPNGCDSIITFTLDVLPAPQQILATDTIIACQFDSVALTSNVLPHSTDYIYQWNPATGLNNPNNANVWFIANASIDYTLSVIRQSNGVSCALNHTTRVIVDPGNFLQSPITDTGICPGNELSILLSGAQHYRWSSISDAISVSSDSATIRFAPQHSNQYTVVGISDKGCADTVAINIEVYPNAVLTLPDTIHIYPEEPYYLEPPTNASYFEWFPNSGINNTASSTPTFYPEVNTRYFVTATTDMGCFIQDSIDVIVKETHVGMPNAFSPNYETFKVSRNGIAKLNLFRIYNRWGQLVFETQDIDQGWDGTLKGIPQANGVYIYQIEAVTPNGQIFKKNGNVTLVR